MAASTNTNMPDQANITWFDDDDDDRLSRFAKTASTEVVAYRPPAQQAPPATRVARRVAKLYQNAPLALFRMRHREARMGNHVGHDEKHGQAVEHHAVQQHVAERSLRPDPGPTIEFLALHACPRSSALSWNMQGTREQVMR